MKQNIKKVCQLLQLKLNKYTRINGAQIKKFGFYFLFSILFLLISSCIKEKIDSIKIIGIWAIEHSETLYYSEGKLTDTDISTKEPSDEYYYTIEFKKDNTYYIIYPNFNIRDSGTYDIQDRKLFIKSVGFENEVDYEVTRKELVLSSKTEEKESYEYYVKVE